MKKGRRNRGERVKNKFSSPFQNKTQRRYLNKDIRVKIFSREGFHREQRGGKSQLEEQRKNHRMPAALWDIDASDSARKKKLECHLGTGSLVRCPSTGKENRGAVVKMEKHQRFSRLKALESRQKRNARPRKNPRRFTQRLEGYQLREKMKGEGPYLERSNDSRGGVEKKHAAERTCN